MKLIEINGTRSNSTETLKPNLWFGRCEWRWAIFLAVAVTALATFAWWDRDSNQDYEFPVVFHHGFVASGDNGNEACNLDDFCASGRPAVLGEIPVTFVAASPSDLLILDSDTHVVQASALWKRTFSTWWQGRMNAHVTLWVPGGFLHNSKLVCGVAYADDCITLQPEVFVYTLPSAMMD